MAKHLDKFTRPFQGSRIPFLLAEVITNGSGDLFVITEKGYGKRTPVSEYPEHKRGGQGVFTITMTDKKGDLAGMKVVAPQHELMIVSE